MTSRADLEKARDELAVLHDEILEAEQELTRSKPARAEQVPPRRAAAVALFALSLLGFGLAAAIPVPTERLPADRVARLAELERSYEEKEREVVATAEPKPPASIPEGAYPALGSLAAEVEPSREGVLAWTQIGLAACTVRRADLAKVALRKLSFEGRESSRGRDGGAMHPGIARGIRQLDDGCQDKGIHLAAEP